MVICEVAEHWGHIAEKSGAWLGNIHKEEMNKGKPLGTSLR